MRVNVYAEEMTDRVEIVSKSVEGSHFTAVRFYLALPATVNGQQYQGPFIHRPGDDDSAAVTFWGKRDLRPMLRKALALLDEHYGEPQPEPPAARPEPVVPILGPCIFGWVTTGNTSVYRCVRSGCDHIVRVAAAKEGEPRAYPHCLKCGKVLEDCGCDGYQGSEPRVVGHPFVSCGHGCLAPGDGAGGCCGLPRSAHAEPGSGGGE